MGAQRPDGAGCRGWRGRSAKLVFCLFFGFTAAHALSGAAAADEIATKPDLDENYADLKTLVAELGIELT